MAARLRGRKEVEDPNNTWNMQLVVACVNGDKEEAAALIAKGAKIDHTAADSQGRMCTPFLMVAQKQIDFEILAWIAEVGGDVNAQFNGDQGTVLHTFVKNDQMELLEKLVSGHEKISPNFSLDVVDSSGQTPTQLAINLNKPDAAKLMLRYGARHQFQSLVDAIHCQTARACVNGQTQLLETLLQAGDNPHQKDCNGQSLMHLAVHQPAVLDILLERGVSINALNWQKQTPLLYSVQNMPKATDVIEALVHRGADVNAGDALAISPLMHAIIAYNTVMIKKLLELKADINVRDQFGGSALHWAVVARNKGALELLLSLDADVNAVDLGGETPLHRACTKGCIQAVTLLLAREGVDINIADKQGRTPLHAAVEERQVAIVQALLKRHTDENPFAPPPGEKGAKKPAAKKGAAQVVEPTISTKLNVEAEDANGRTALQIAVALNHTDLVKALVGTGSNVRRPSKYGTLLHEAVYDGNETIVATLLSSKAIVDARDERNFTPLHIAAQRGFVGISKLLIEAKATVDLQDFNTLQSALHIACRQNDVPLVQLLLGEGRANTHLSDSSIRTPLHHACLNGCLSIIQALLAAGAMPFRIVDLDGWTPLHCAVSVDCHAAIELLTSRELVVSNNGLEVTSYETYLGDVISKDKKGWTPLHVAVASGAAACVTSLIDLLRQYTIQNEVSKVELTANTEPLDSHTTVAKIRPGENLKAALASAAAAAAPYAVKKRRNELMEVLSLADNNDRVPFMLAAEFGYTSIAKILVRAKREETERTMAVMM